MMYLTCSGRCNLRRNFLPAVSLAIAFVGFCFGQQPYTPNLETELRTALYSNYEVLQRPAENNPVNISLNLITINYLDIKNQELSISGYFQMIWQDNRLDWSKNTSNYGNIRFLFSSETYTWRPAVVIENSVSNLAVFSDTNTLIRVISNGNTLWTPGGIFTTSCEADITYYPFDSQTCSIIITTWAYTSSEISLNVDSPAFNMDNFHENGEWQLSSTSTSASTAARSAKESYTYDRLYFNLKLKRRPLYHILNTIFPVVLMASLVCLVFKLPPESGERISMSLTVLLAYAVYLTLIADSIPKTSRSASILSTYLTFILLMSTLSVIFTIVVLDIYFNHKDDEDMPGWLQSFTKIFLVRMALWKGVRFCNKSKVSPSKNEKKENKTLTLKKVPPQDEHYEKAQVDDKIYSWKEVALILDNCFMYLFIFLIVLCTVICLAMFIANF